MKSDLFFRVVRVDKFTWAEVRNSFSLTFQLGVDFDEFFAHCSVSFFRASNDEEIPALGHALVPIGVIEANSEYPAFFVLSFFHNITVFLCKTIIPEQPVQVKGSNDFRVLE